MSGPRGIPLRHAPDDRGYRLIELPPELQALLESDNPPVLTLESSDSSALLKSPSKTYALRQKNTSNSIILLSTDQATPPTAADIPSNIDSDIISSSIPNEASSNSANINIPSSIPHDAPPSTDTTTIPSTIPFSMTSSSADAIPTGIVAISTIKETVELETIAQPSHSGPPPPAASKGKWHEKFGSRR